MDCMARMTRWLAFYTPSLSIVPDDFQDNVNDSNVGVNESIFFSFVCPMIIKMQKSLLNLIYSQMFAFSR